MPESVRRSLWPVIFSTVAGMLVYMVMIALNAGAMEQRVKAVELERMEWAQQQKAQDEKLDKMLSLAQDIRVSVARVEAQLEAHSRVSKADPR